MNAKSPRYKIELLEGVRGILAVWVMLGHFLLFLGVLSTPYQLLSKITSYLANGAIPVALFMTLSGFVITLLINTKKEPYFTYISRRFLRLFPAFGFCLLVGFFISPWQYDLVHLPWSNTFPWLHHQSDLALLHQQHAFGNILTHLVMLHGLIPGCYLPDSTGAFLGVGWSISTEWQFYLIAPLALWLARRKLGLIFVACVVIAFTSYFSFINHFINFVNESPSLILFHLQYFFIGSLSYFLWNALHTVSTSTLFSKVQGMVILGLAFSFCVKDPVLPLWIFIFSSLCQMTINPAAFDVHLISSVLCSKVSLFLGRISYSIYLAHWPIAIIALKFFNSFWNLHVDGTAWALFVVMFLIVTSLITIIAAHFLYRYVEKPAIDWGKRIFREA